MRFYLFMIFVVSWFQWFECKKVSIKILPENDGNLGREAIELPTNCGFSFVYNATNKPPSKRIVNGIEAPKYAWPWAAYLIYNYQITDAQGSASWVWNSCTGSIITRRHILTAAHCLKQKDTKVDKVGLNVYVLIGCENVIQGVEDAKLYKENTACGQLIREFQHWTWSRYDPAKGLYDLSIIELSKDISFKSYDIQPICLPTDDAYPVGDAYATGWGQEGFNPPNTFAFKTSTVLRQAYMPLIDNSSCFDKIGEERWSSCTLCAGEKGQATCQGDSGGPIQYQDQNGRWYQAGVVTGSFQCGDIQNGNSFPTKFVRTNCPDTKAYIKGVISAAADLPIN